MSKIKKSCETCVRNPSKCYLHRDCSHKYFKHWVIKPSLKYAEEKEPVLKEVLENKSISLEKVLSLIETERQAMKRLYPDHSHAIEKLCSRLRIFITTELVKDD